MINDIRLTKENYLLTYFLIAITGMNYISAGDGFMIIGFIVSLFLFFRRGLQYSNIIVYYISFFIILHILQFLILGGFEPTTMLKIVMRILIAYHILSYVGLSFIQCYINVIYFFSLISFVFYFSSLLFPSIANFFIEVITPYTQPLFYQQADFQDMIIFNFGAQEFSRNSGPFWEPGAFAGFLCIAIMFEYLVNNKIFNRKKIVFYIAMLTTLSTSGYLTLFFMLLFFFFSQAKRFYPIFLIILLIPFGYNTYFNYSFLSNEINRGILNASGYHNSAKVGVNRFTSALLDFRDMKKSPIVGISDNGRLRYGKYYEDKHTEGKTWTHRNNGITYFLSSFGIIGFTVYFLCMFKSFNRLSLLYGKNWRYAIFMLGVIFMIGFSEKYFTRELFFGLSILFIAFNFKIYKKGSE